MKAPKVIWTRQVPARMERGRWVYETQRVEVRVLAEAEGYAMVRRPRAMPFVVSMKSLSLKEAA